MQISNEVPHLVVARLTNRYSDATAGALVNTAFEVMYGTHGKSKLVLLSCVDDALAL
jgi:hypothetical protein